MSLGEINICRRPEVLKFACIKTSNCYNYGVCLCCLLASNSIQGEQIPRCKQLLWFYVYANRTCNNGRSAATSQLPATRAITFTFYKELKLLKHAELTSFYLIKYFNLQIKVTRNPYQIPNLDLKP